MPALLLFSIAAGCGSSRAGAPVDTPRASARETTEQTAAPPATDPNPPSTPGASAPTSVPPDSVTTTVLLADQQPPDSIPPPTTAPAIEPVRATYAPLIGESPVLALAAVLGVEGDVEQLGGEHGPGYCVGRLEPRGLCVNVPLWGGWQYWDLDAQNSQGASDEKAGEVARDLFVRIGVDPGVVMSIAPNGPLPQVELSNGALVMVAQDGRIAWAIAGTTQMPPG